jgi:DNA (cytosine-5)-methyltransferase 1
VFVIGYLGDWRPPAAVLFERQSLRRDTAPSREKGQRVTECAGTLTANGGGLNRPAGNANELDFCVTVKKWPADTTCTLNAAFGNKLGLEDQHINGGASLFVPQPVTYDLYNVTAPVNGQRRNPGDPCHTLARANAEHAAVVSIQGNLIGREAGGPQGVGASDKDVMYTLTKADVHGVAQPIAPALTASNDPSRSPQSSEVTQQVAAVHAASMAVRRLTPVECERLQGFPDNYTNIKENCPDGPRYKALGNSMAVPVMRWIGNRIEKHRKVGTED